METDTNGRAGRLRALADGIRSPEFATDLIQIVKCTVAATLAWWISEGLLDSELPFLAPWTALLTVHATVHRSLSRGAQSAFAGALGVGLTFLIGHFLGVHLWTFALAIFVGLAASRLTWLREEGIAVATTAVFIFTSDFGSQAQLLDDRLLELGLGVAVGILVNLAVAPPLRDRQAARFVDHLNRRMGGVLVEMADDLEDEWDTARADSWIAETVALDQELETAWGTVRFARESQSMNPRRLRPLRGSRGSDAERVGYEEILARIGEGISHLRNLTRTVREATHAESRWDDDFRQQWVAIVRDAGQTIQDPDAEVEPVQERLTSLATRFTPQEGVATDHWPVYGSLITSMRHIAVIVDDVASAREARQSAA